MRAMNKRLEALEGGAKSEGRVFTLFRWSSQDRDEAARRWTEDRIASGADVPGENDTLMHVVFMDPGGFMANNWSQFAWQKAR